MKEESNEIIPFYELPLYHAMIDKILLFGAPINAIVFNCVIAIIFILYFHFWWILLITVFLHFIFVNLSKNDAPFFDVLIVYQRKSKYYST